MYDSFNVKRIINNRKFWQSIKPNFTGKTLEDERMTPVDGDKVIKEEKNAIKKFMDHFEKNLEALKADCPILFDIKDDPVLNGIIRFCEHASVLKIKQVRISSDCFSFKSVTI